MTVSAYILRLPGPRGVILEEQESGLRLLCRAGVTPDTLLGVRRVAGAPFSVEILGPEAFDEQLMANYQRDSSEARQLMEDIGNEIDFFTPGRRVARRAKICSMQRMTSSA